MSDLPSDRWEERLRAAARAFPYPPTPDLTRPRPMRAPARRLRPAWGAALLAALALAGLLAVPQVRAAVLEWLQVGVIRIFLPAPAATEAPAPPPTSPGPIGEAPVTATPLAGARPPAPLEDLAGATTLADARERAGFHVPLPAYPADLGAPDHVFLQDQGGPVAVLVWMEPGDPAAPRLSLHLLHPGSWGIDKLKPRAVQTAQVNGRPAVWAEGPYFLLYRGEPRPQRLVPADSHVLIWQAEDGVTYRLESALPLEEAIRVAESLE